MWITKASFLLMILRGAQSALGPSIPFISGCTGYRSIGYYSRQVTDDELTK